MAIIYSVPAITARLQGVVTAIGNNGLILLRGGNVVYATITLASPCGTVNAGVLTFTGNRVNPSIVGGGFADNAEITTSAGALMISGLTVGIPLSGANVIIQNGLNSTLLQASQVVTMLSGQIIGS